MQLSLQDMYMFSIAPVDYDNVLCMKALHLVMSVSLCVLCTNVWSSSSSSSSIIFFITVSVVCVYWSIL